MMEPLAVAWHGVKRSGFNPGDKCLVLGSGPVSAIRYGSRKFRSRRSVRRLALWS